MSLSDVFILEFWHPAKKPQCAKDLLLKHGCLEMADNFEVLLAINIA